MGKSKNKVVDLKPENISEEHLKELQGIVQALNKLHYDVGVLEMRKSSIAETVKEGNATLNKFRDVLGEKYGKYNIDITTGKLDYESDDKPSDS
jgi:hypothetical protein|tara:strand:+ start:34 stop:315 length:282 start_codon:yes stop_codon:yes gene_type:complete